MNIIILNKKNQTGGEYIGRPSPLGNPFSTKKDSIADFIVKTHDECIDLYEQWLNIQIDEFNFKVYEELNRLIDIHESTGELYLSCWCKPKRCHGDIIRKVLNDRHEQIKKLYATRSFWNVRFNTKNLNEIYHASYQDGYFYDYHSNKPVLDKVLAYHIANNEDRFVRLVWS